VGVFFMHQNSANALLAMPLPPSIAVQANSQYLAQRSVQSLIMLPATCSIEKNAFLRIVSSFNSLFQYAMNAALLWLEKRPSDRIRVYLDVQKTQEGHFVLAVSAIALSSL
jgi:hypothetical protein